MSLRLALLLRFLVFLASCVPVALLTTWAFGQSAASVICTFYGIGIGLVFFVIYRNDIQDAL